MRTNGRERASLQPGPAPSLLACGLVRPLDLVATEDEDLLRAPDGLVVAVLVVGGRHDPGGDARTTLSILHLVALGAPAAAGEDVDVHRSNTMASQAIYHSFVTWEPLTPEVQAENFLRFWNWLMGIRAASLEAGLTFRAYCYNASAESTYLRSLGRATDMLDNVEEFIASDDWVDMLRVFDSQLITGGGSGLKAVAPLAGFSWSVDDPGGAESMLRYDVAVGSLSEAERDAARGWLIAYNRGDVEATFSIPKWLDRDSKSIVQIESLDPVSSVT